MVRRIVHLHLEQHDNAVRHDLVVRLPGVSGPLLLIAGSALLFVLSRDYERRARGIAREGDPLGGWSATARVHPYIRALAAGGACVGAVAFVVRLVRMLS